MGIWQKIMGKMNRTEHIGDMEESFGGQQVLYTISYDCEIIAAEMIVQQLKHLGGETQAHMSNAGWTIVTSVREVKLFLQYERGEQQQFGADHHSEDSYGSVNIINIQASAARAQGVIRIMVGELSHAVKNYHVLTEVLICLAAVEGALLIRNDMADFVLHPKQVIQAATLLEQGTPPMMLWVYIGQRCQGEQNICYTRGLSYFAQSEVEIHSTEQLHPWLFDHLHAVAEYLVSANEVLQLGETIRLFNAQTKQSIQPTMQQTDTGVIQIHC